MSSGNVHKVHSDDIDVANDTPVDGVRGELDSAGSPSASTITGPEAALFSTSAPAVDPLPVHFDMVERSGLRKLPPGKKRSASYSPLRRGARGESNPPPVERGSSS